MYSKEQLRCDSDVIVIGASHNTKAERALITNFKTGHTVYTEVYANRSIARSVKLGRIINRKLNPAMFEVCFELNQQDSNSKLPRGIERKMLKKKSNTFNFESTPKFFIK